MSRRMGWGRGETGRRSKAVFTAGTEPRAATLKRQVAEWGGRGLPGTAPSLPGAGELGGQKRTPDLGFSMGSPQTLKRDWGKTAGTVPPLPLPCLGKQSLIEP